MRPLFQHPPSAKPIARAVVPLVFFAVLFALAPAQGEALHAQTPEPAAPKPAFSESQAQGIDRMIMCPVCPAETIDQAQVEISRQMRVMVREMLAEGKERDEILDFFVERYGQDILAAPPKSGANLMVWLLPVAGFIAALVAVFFIIRSMTRRGGPVLATPRPVQDVGLIPYLHLVDHHLNMTRGGGGSPVRISPRPGGTSNQPCSTVESPGTVPNDPTDPSEGSAANSPEAE